MLEIITLLSCLAGSIESTSLRQLSQIVAALLSMTGRVTMRGISRWGDTGLSYRTVQRFYHTSLPWGRMLWLLFVHHLWCPGEAYLLVGDESVVTKAGRKTYGLDRFFSSIYNRPVPGLSFFALSVVGIKEGVSHPVMIEQVVKEPKDKEKTKSTKSAKSAKSAKQTKNAKRTTSKKGRPKGSKNKDKTQIEWTAEMVRISRMVKKLLGLINGLIGLRYFVLDGYFGNNNVLQVVRQELGLHLISKLQWNSALHFEYQGEQKPCGRDRRYGVKVDYAHLPESCCVKETYQNGIRTRLYQAPMLHQCFAQTLNVVIVVKTNVKSGARAHVVLFSSDLELEAQQLVQYYRLRFQIEFNFRDAKQFWGLEDFMNVKETPVTNAANLSFFMVNLSHCLLKRFRERNPHAGILDLKAAWHGQYYAQIALKLLPQKPDGLLIELIMHNIQQQGAIHAQQHAGANA